MDAWTYDGPRPSERARSLSAAEITGIVTDFARAAERAMDAGFDGVEIHGANGMLIDQFLRNSSNLRTDDYGGSIANRIRLLDQVTRAVAAAIGADRTAVRLSPNGETWGVDDSDPTPLFVAAAQTLNGIGIAFLELKEANPDGAFVSTDVPHQSPMMRPHFNGPLILNADYDLIRARTALGSGIADGISFGCAFLANPDLVDRLRKGAALNEAQRETFYSQSAAGYLDYPTLADEQTAA